MSDKRAVLMVISSLGVGGAEKMLVNIANRLDRDRFNTTVVVLSEHLQLAGAIDDAVRVVGLPKRWRYDLGPAGGIREIVQREGIDSILCFGLYEFFFVRRALGNLHRPPAVFISIHHTHWAERRRRWLHWTYARFLSGSERIISVCDTQADYWTVSYGIPRDRFTTIYNGVDVDHFAPPNGSSARIKIRERHGIPLDAIVLVQVASFNEYKRHEDSLAAMELVQREATGRPVYLLLVGGGLPERESELRAMADDLGLSRRVFFCGRATDVRPFYAAADIFTLTSAWGETFSVAALEAMSMGLPAVITDSGGAREMIEPGFNGYLVRPGDPIHIARGWRRAIEALPSFDGSAIRRRVAERFALDDCVRRHEAMLLGDQGAEVIDLGLCPSEELADEGGEERQQCAG